MRSHESWTVELWSNILLKSVCFNNHKCDLCNKELFHGTALSFVGCRAQLIVYKNYCSVEFGSELATWLHSRYSDDQEAKYLNVTYTTEHTATAIKVLFSLDFQTFASSSRFTFFFIFSTRPVIFCFLSSLFRLRSSVALLRGQDKDSCLYLSKGKESLFYAGTLKIIVIIWLRALRLTLHLFYFLSP